MSIIINKLKKNKNKGLLRIINKKSLRKVFLHTEKIKINNNYKIILNYIHS